VLVVVIAPRSGHNDGMLSRRALGLAAFGGVAAWATRARAQEIPTMALSIAVATIGKKSIVSEAWLKEQVSETQRLFAPHGLSLSVLRRRVLQESRARLETGDDRDALAELIEPQVINVFVVYSLRDVDDPRLFRMGVRWRKRDNLKKDYVIIAESAMPTTLCHELGHYFGNSHSPVVNNVMSYKRDDDSKIAFDEHQGRRMRTVARSHLKNGKLVPFDQLHKPNASTS
jgi:hypothetical protein